jgi:HEAT repeat protein
LGTLKATDKLPAILQASDTPSHNDLLRQAALESLAALDVPQGLPVAIRYSLAGAYNRTRPTAIDSLATLAHHDKDAAYKILAGLLDDRESRAWHAAGNALVKLNDPRAIPDLEKLAAAKRSGEDKKQVHDWIEAIKAKEHASVSTAP